MAKSQNTQVSQELDLAQVAAKFVAIPKDVTSKDRIISGGYLSEAEYEVIKQLPRATEMESGTKWAKIKAGDKERSLYPFYGCLTETEKQIYRDYKKGHSSGSAGGTSATSVKADENNKALDELKAELTELGVPAETIAKLEQFRKTKKNNLIAEMFGVDYIQALSGKVNLAYIMFRGPNGEFSEDLQPNMVSLVQKGFMPKFTLQQVKDNVEKLAAKGIDVHATIVDLQ